MIPNVRSNPAYCTARFLSLSVAAPLYKTTVLRALCKESSRPREAREEAKSVEQSARPGRTSFFGSSRLGDGADLLHQAKLVLDGPRLGDLAFLYAVDGYPREFDSIASRGDVHVGPLVGGSAPPMSNHLVPLGYYVLYGAYHIREASTEIRCLLLGSLGLIGSEEFLCCVEVTGMVPELLLLPTYFGPVEALQVRGRGTPASGQPAPARRGFEGIQSGLEQPWNIREDQQRS